MSALDKFLNILTPEELGWMKQLKDSMKDDLKKLSQEEAEKKIAQRTIYEYRLMDKQGILTRQQEKRWNELLKKAEEFGLKQMTNNAATREGGGNTMKTKDALEIGRALGRINSTIDTWG